MNEQLNKPTIVVLFNPDLSGQSEFSELLYGIEEEGIPFDVLPLHGSSAIELSHHAAMKSKLGVGIGISKTEIAMHYEKLEASKPLFVLNRQAQSDRVRALGANAAKLVKRMPFKEL